MRDFCVDHYYDLNASDFLSPEDLEGLDIVAPNDFTCKHGYYPYCPLCEHGYVVTEDWMLEDQCKWVCLLEVDDV